MGNPEENRNRTGKGTGEIPDLKLTARTDRFIGKYGRMREIYLREHEPVFYSRLVLDEKIYPYLIETEQKVQERMDHILPELMEEAGIQEGGMYSNSTDWIERMEKLRRAAEKQAVRELVYC